MRRWSCTRLSQTTISSTGLLCQIRGTNGNVTHVAYLGNEANKPRRRHSHCRSVRLSQGHTVCELPPPRVSGWMPLHQQRYGSAATATTVMKKTWPIGEPGRGLENVLRGPARDVKIAKGHRHYSKKPGSHPPAATRTQPCPAMLQFPFSGVRAPSCLSIPSNVSVPCLTNHKCSHPWSFSWLCLVPCMKIPPVPLLQMRASSLALISLNHTALFPSDWTDLSDLHLTA